MTKRRKFYFVQEWGTYSNETLVVVGMTKDEILALLKRKKYNKDIVNRFTSHGPSLECFSTKAAFVWAPPQFGATLLYFPEWRFDWDHIETLVHEINHLLFFVLGQKKGMSDETEAMAYQNEFLFREIRRKLFKYGKTKGRKK